MLVVLRAWLQIRRGGSDAADVEAFNWNRIMAVAFTREEDAEAAAAHLPDRPVSPHRNLVTPAGLAALDAALAAAMAAYGDAQAAGDVRTDRTSMALAARDLRYYRARRATAEVVELAPGPGAVQFGGTVTFDREDGRRQTFRIVGEDEADAAKGSVSHVSPLAKALRGKAVGDTAIVAGGEVEVVAIGRRDGGNPMPLRNGVKLPVDAGLYPHPHGRRRTFL